MAKRKVAPTEVRPRSKAQILADAAAAVAEDEKAAAEPGRATEEAVKVARFAGNTGALRELDALALALVDEMEKADPDVRLRASSDAEVKDRVENTSRKELVDGMILAMEHMEPAVAFRFARDQLPKIAPGMPWPTPLLSPRDAFAKGLLPTICYDICEYETRVRGFFKLRYEDFAITKKEMDRRIDRHTKAPDLPDDRRLIAQVAARSLGLSGKALDHLLFNSEHAAKSKARKRAAKSEGPST